MLDLGLSNTSGVIDNKCERENWEPVNIFLLDQMWRQEWKLKAEI